MSEESYPRKNQNLLVKSFVTGFVGALLWGAISSLGYFMSFSTVSHASFILRSFFTGSWTEGWSGELISLLILGLLGTIPAIIYYYFFKKFARVIHGVIYGVILWAVFFILLNPYFSYVPNFNELEMDTIAATVCQFVMYGVFVAYTIAFDANGERITFQE